MSNNRIKQLCETRLKTLAPDFPTAWENVNFKPPVGPFQVPTFLFADPDLKGSADAPYIQRGYMIVTLAYPTNQGGGAAQVKAESIRDYFYAGTTIVGETFNVVVETVPDISNGAVEGDRFIIRVRIRFFAHIDRG